MIHSTTSKSSLSRSNKRELWLYVQTTIFAVAVFGACYAYITWLQIPGELNKSVADTAIILMGLSMLLSSICYFFNAVDWMIIYRKYLGLVGFAFGIVHLILSWDAFLGLLRVLTGEPGAIWPALTGLIALVIFTIMALISNTFSAKHLGGRNWKFILRTGYLAVILVWLHVVLLKSNRWVSWYQEGMLTPPSLSLLVTLFMTIVVLMRLLLWWSVSRKKSVTKVV